jgi:hypothetical protein
LIGETLAYYALQGAIGTGFVVYAKRDSIVIPKIKLSQIAMKVPFPAMLVVALHATLEDREITLNRIGVYVVAGVFADTMLDGLVRCKIGVSAGVKATFIGMQSGLARDVFDDDIGNGPFVSVLDMEGRSNFAAALNQRNDGPSRALIFPPFLQIGRGAWAHQPLFLCASEIGFIHLYNTAFTTHWRKAACAHGLTDAMRNEPRGLESAAQGTVKLVRANALLRGRKQEDRLQPKMHGDVAGFEDSPNLHGEGLAALVALVSANTGALAAHLGDTLYAAAMRAHGAVRPNAGFYPSVGRLFVLQMLGVQKGLHDCSPIRAESHVRHLFLSSFHSDQNVFAY